MTESTAVATVDQEIEAIRKQGALELARRRTIADVVSQIDAAEWGAGNAVVKGESFSPQAKASMARFCHTLGAHPQLHVDLLGGKPYLNAAYFYDQVNDHPYFVDFTENDISEDAEKRKHYRVPDWAAVAYEVVIRKLANFAPIERIRSGEITDWQSYVVEVREANWAGGKPKETKKKRDGGTYTYDPDPVGNAEPAKTARTRAFRRCAVRAFPTWKARFEEQVERQERIIEAEWTMVTRDEEAARAALPSPGGPQAVSTAAGEPTAAAPAGARPLPIEGEDDGPDHEIVVDGDVTDTVPEEQPWDPADARKRFFATLREIGVTGDARKKWAKDNGFPDSTSQWTREDYNRAQEIMVGPVRDRVMELCEEQGVNLAEVSLAAAGVEHPDYLKHWKQVLEALEAEGDEEGDL